MHYSRTNEMCFWTVFIRKRICVHIARRPTQKCHFSVLLFKAYVFNMQAPLFCDHSCDVLNFINNLWGWNVHYKKYFGCRLKCSRFRE